MTSLPKAGTHLATAALDHFPDLRFSGIYVYGRELARSKQDSGHDTIPELDWDRVRTALARPKPGQYMVTHFPAYEELIEILGELGFRVVFVYRDPRDIVVSTAMYIKRLSRHPHHRRFTEVYTSDTERVLAIVTGFPPDEHGPGLPPFRVRLQAYLPWMSAPKGIACSFEELVGEAGGGSRTAQVAILRRIGDHINRPLSDRIAAEIGRHAWSARIPTFRTGVIGEWRPRFDDPVQEVFAAEVGDGALTAYGYEPST